MRKKDPGLWNAMHAPSAYENARLVEDQLKEGKTFGEIFGWANDASLPVPDRGQRLAGLRAFSMGLNKHLNPDVSMGQHTPEQEGLDKASLEVWERTNAEYEKLDFKAALAEQRKQPRRKKRNVAWQWGWRGSEKTQ